jgi:ankyrin repeat/SOCS box protein 13/metal transporter CNNM
MSGPGWVNCTFDVSAGNDSIECLGDEYFDEGRDEPLSASFWMDVSICVFFVLFAGTMSGLTLGLLSLDPMTLRIMAASTAPDDAVRAQRARRVLPIIRRKHWLLSTLLTANAGAMEALPIFLDRIVGPVPAVIISVTAVLIFGEIVPQAACARYGLAIGAFLAPMVWLLMMLLRPIGFPLSLILDWVLGKDHGTYYRRAELKEFIGMHAGQSLPSHDEHATDKTSREISRLKRLGLKQQYATADGGNGGSGGGGGGGGGDGHEAGDTPITIAEANIIRGALEMNNKTVADVCTPINECFSIFEDQIMDDATLTKLRVKAFSRVPVQNRHSGRYVGVLLTHMLVGLSGERAQRALVNLVPLRTVPSTMPLYSALSSLKRGSVGHMFLVADSTDSDRIVGLVTLEDILESLLQTEIYDEVERGFAQSDRAVELDNDDASMSTAQTSKLPPVVLANQRLGVSKRLLDQVPLLETDEKV